jgi:hypothetical protein
MCKMAIAMKTALVIALLTVSAAAHAQAPGETDRIRPNYGNGRDTDRVMVAGGGAVFANYPMSMEDPGFALFVNKPLWLGTRYAFFQWALDASSIVGFGTYEKHAYLVGGAQFGPNFYFGSVFGLEFRWGLGGMMQVGERMAPAILLTGAAAYVFRFWDDDRKRVKLWLSMNFGGYLASDPMNDLGANAGVLGAGLAYERPY